MRTTVVYDGTPGVRWSSDELVVVGASAQNLAHVALDYAMGGARRVELCGGVSLETTGRVAEAAPPHVSIGSVRYAYDALPRLLAFREAELAGTPMPFAAIFLVPTGSERRVDHADGVFVGVNDPRHVPTAVSSLPDGIGLIELYAGLDARDAAAAARVGSHSAPIGFVDAVGR
jgi:hypothetical protein